MGLTQYYVASSIDGFIADDNDGLDWLMQFGFESFQDHYDRFMVGVGAMVMGSHTYDYFLTEGPDAWTYGTRPAWVMTTRELPGIAGADIRFARGDVAAVHELAMASADGANVWIIGGGNVAAQFLDRGLLDELYLGIMPVVLGSGKPLLPITSVTAPLELLRTTHFDRGAVELVYSLGRPAP